ncbi:MAG: hypothetical protein CMM52_14075 [Rhodospirillaceae bacterium]|nr:hypothetical protein [Rhodospirillaceae bacterium]
MAFPGFAAEKAPRLNILISNASGATAGPARALQQIAGDIIISKLASDGHLVRVLARPDRKGPAKLHRISTAQNSQKKSAERAIGIILKSELRLYDKVYTRHARLNLETVIRKPRRNAIISRLRIQPMSWRIPEDCNLACASDTARTRIENSAKRLARAISKKLDRLALRLNRKAAAKKSANPFKSGNRQKMLLSIVGINSALVRDIEDYLIVIPGNRSVLRDGNTFAITRSTKAPPIQPLLRKMLNQLGISADIRRRKSQIILKAQSSGTPETSSINW